MLQKFVEMNLDTVLGLRDLKKDDLAKVEPDFDKLLEELPKHDPKFVEFMNNLAKTSNALSSFAKDCPGKVPITVNWVADCIGHVQAKFSSADLFPFMRLAHCAFDTMDYPGLK
jgi:hypothetical protein